MGKNGTANLMHDSTTNDGSAVNSFDAVFKVGSINFKYVRILFEDKKSNTKESAILKVSQGSIGSNTIAVSHETLSSIPHGVEVKYFKSNAFRFNIYKLLHDPSQKIAFCGLLIGIIVIAIDGFLLIYPKIEIAFILSIISMVLKIFVLVLLFFKDLFK